MIRDCTLCHTSNPTTGRWKPPGPVFKAWWFFHRRTSEHRMRTESMERRERDLANPNLRGFPEPDPRRSPLSRERPPTPPGDGPGIRGGTYPT